MSVFGGVRTKTLSPSTTWGKAEVGELYSAGQRKNLSCVLPCKLIRAGKATSVSTAKLFGTFRDQWPVSKANGAEQKIESTVRARQLKRGELNPPEFLFVGAKLGQTALHIDICSLQAELGPIKIRPTIHVMK